MSDAHAATQREEQTFRVFEGEPHYIDGYTPSSLDSQHSSLQRSSTWLGMGFILTSLAGLGAFVFGLSSSIAGTQENGSTYAIIGAVLAISCLVLGFGLIYYARRNYRADVPATGRKH